MFRITKFFLRIAVIRGRELVRERFRQARIHHLIDALHDVALICFVGSRFSLA
jgi:hypothetical protein